MSLFRLTLDTNPEDCNFHCIMCEEHSPYSNFKEELKKATGYSFRRMPESWLAEIFQQAKELGVKEIIPSTMGEPLLYSGMVTIATLCKEHQIALNLTTNGTFVKFNQAPNAVEEWAKFLLPILSDMKISWNGATAETVSKVQPDLDFAGTIERIKTWVHLRNKYYQNTGHYAKLSWQMTFMTINMHELPDMVKLASQLGIDRIKGHHLWVHFSQLKQYAIKNFPNEITRWNQYVEQAYQAQKEYLKYDGKQIILENITPLSEDKNLQVPDEYNCPFLNRELWISATGKISPCCAPDNLRNSLGDFGNFPSTSLKEVLESQKYLDLVQNYKDIPLCKNCNMRK